MPLPRFERLPTPTKEAILTVARDHFARDGKDAASFNQIIADAGISKTSAYHYFDGKDDLFTAVAADAAVRTLAILGPWRVVSTVEELWRQVAEGSTRLLTYLRKNPSDRAVLAAAAQLGTEGDPWVQAFVANAVDLGLSSDEDGWLSAVTAALFAAADRWALSHPGLPDEQVADRLVALLRRTMTS
ncbi:TetR/AcrR family transcriptional regulator [Nocardia abscessus]|uniref:TetR/AcrR family transcriptional regulator n=1 Tax=Nocardia abscessus TaxID=120957 RepID=UPI002453EA86|nr:TetR/AcrR family transcriptional regulator [Nocardia abscessus]